jgi:hypothetical protein
VVKIHSTRQSIVNIVLTLQLSLAARIINVGLQYNNRIFTLQQQNIHSTTQLDFICFDIKDFPKNVFQYLGQTKNIVNENNFQSHRGK